MFGGFDHFAAMTEQQARQEQQAPPQAPTAEDEAAAARAKAHEEAAAREAAEAKAAAAAKTAAAAEEDSSDDEDDEEADDESTLPTLEEVAEADAAVEAAAAKAAAAAEAAASVEVPVFDYLMPASASAPEKGEVEGEEGGEAPAPAAPAVRVVHEGRAALLLDTLEELTSGSYGGPDWKSFIDDKSYLAQLLRQRKKEGGGAEGAGGEEEGEEGAAEKTEEEKEKEKEKLKEKGKGEEEKDPGKRFGKSAVAAAAMAAAGEEEDEAEAGAGEAEAPEESIPRASLLAFFDAVEAKLRSGVARGALRALALSDASSDSSAGGLGVHRGAVQPALVAMQRTCFSQLGIHVGDGCAALTVAEIEYAGDAEVLGRRREFLDLCRMAFLTAVDDARRATPPELLEASFEAADGSAKESAESLPVLPALPPPSEGPLDAASPLLAPMQASGGLTREQVEGFLDVVTTVFDLEATKRDVRKLYSENGGDRVETIQRQLHESRAAKKEAEAAAKAAGGGGKKKGGSRKGKKGKKAAAAAAGGSGGGNSAAILTDAQEKKLEEEQMAVGKAAARAVGEKVLELQYESFERLGVERGVVSRGKS